MRRARTLVLPATQHAPSLVRDVLRQACDHLPPVVLDDAQLLSTELVSNALRHSTSTTITVSFDSDDEAIVVEVTDQDDGRLGVRLVSLTAESGRGLRLVEEVATAWGTRPRVPPPGKVVWFRLGGGLPAGST